MGKRLKQQAAPFSLPPEPAPPQVPTRQTRAARALWREAGRGQGRPQAAGYMTGAPFSLALVSTHKADHKHDLFSRTVFGRRVCPETHGTEGKKDKKWNRKYRSRMSPPGYRTRHGSVLVVVSTGGCGGGGCRCVQPRVRFDRRAGAVSALHRTRRHSCATLHYANMGPWRVCGSGLQAGWKGME
jgi:hypothetical protein